MPLRHSSLLMRLGLMPGTKVSVYATEMFIFVDETGSDARNKEDMTIIFVENLPKIKHFRSEGNVFQQLHACPQLDYWMCRPFKVQLLERYSPDPPLTALNAYNIVISPFDVFCV